jgi:protein SERAC1
MGSAILPAYLSIGIHRNHIDMTKLEGASDPEFVSLTGEVRRWVKELEAPLARSFFTKPAKFYP